MLTGVHFLLTYACNYECDHCFVYSRPTAKGTFTIEMIKDVLAQASDAGTVEWIFFEGGEPFLYFPLMLEGIRLANGMGFKTGVVTNQYWANSEGDAELWLRPLKEAGISDLSVSSDHFHCDDENDPTDMVSKAARELGIPSTTLCIETGEPATDSKVLLRGRAVDKLTEDLERKPGNSFTSCDDEELREPSRVHVDPFGNVHVCQGVLIGNLLETPLKEIMSNFVPEEHHVIGTLLEGGPARLAEVHGIEGGEFCSACHMCFEVRRELVDSLSEVLGPKGVYGLD